MEYVTGDQILIKNIVSLLKSQGIFDQIRKECIADVDTKPAYQNLCHRADTQVSKFLSKVKWGPDLHKNQTRENIRRQVNDFVEPGIAIIVDQLVNPRINTVLVPKVEDVLYKYLGIPREVDTSTSHKETKSSNDKSSIRDVPDNSVPGISRAEMHDKKRDVDKQYFDGSQDHYRMENQKHEGINSGRNDTSTNKMQSADNKYDRDKSSYIKSESFDSNIKDLDKSVKTEPEKHYLKTDMKVTPIPEFDSESSDDEMSPPFEPNEKSDNDMSIGSGDSNFSEIIETNLSGEPGVPGVDPEIDIDTVCKAENSKIVTEREDSLDSVQSTNSTPVAPEKVQISPLEIPKTPTINYETSDDSDDYVKNKKLDTVTVEAAEPLEVPEVNFDKIVEKVIEDNSEPKAREMTEIKAPKEEDKYKDKNRTDDAKKKDKPKYKDDKSIKPAENKEKHSEKKSEHRSDKDRKYDKHRSEHKSKDRDKEKPRHDSSKSHSSRKDDKSHHSRDHSKSEHDRKSKSEHKKDDYKKDEKPDHKKDSGRSDHKKDDRSDHKKDDKSEHRKDPKTDRKKEEDRKHSKDDKDRKKDSHKVLSTDDKKSSKPTKPEDSKTKYDKPRDDKKNIKTSDHNKSKKKEEDQKKSRSHCNLDEKKKTDRRSSDRDSSGPSTSNSSSIHHASSQHSSKSEKDKQSTKHRHSSSSSSHKTKRNDTEHDKNHSEKPPVKDQEKILAVEDDLEMILESSPDKGFQNSMKPDTNFSSRKIFPEKANEQSNDHIEHMMNEMFQPTKPVLKKPKIAKNFADIRRIMKLRKLYEEDVKLKSHENNIDESDPDIDKSTLYKIKLRRTVDYFVIRRFGKNGNNLDKCKDLTNAIIETLTDVKLNITRVDRRYSLVDGSCLLSDEEIDPIHINNVLEGNSNCTKSENEIDSISIIEDERANLILEDLANSYTDPNFKLGTVPEDDKSDLLFVKLQPFEEDMKLFQSEIKANGAKAKLPKQLTTAENDDKPKEIVDSLLNNPVAEDDNTSSTLKLKIKSVSDGKNKRWLAYDQLEQIEDPHRYFPLPNYNSNFMQFANKLLNEAYDFEVENLSVEMDYPECYDFMFTEFLGAKVYRRKSDDPKTSPIKYNSEIINKKTGDKSIMLRIKKSSESEEFADKKILNKKRKLADDSGVELDNPESGKEEPVKKKKKTLGIKRTLVNPLKMKLTSGQLSDTVGNDLTENTTPAKTKNMPVPKKVAKVKKSKEMAIANANHKKSESESSDGRRSSVSSTGTSTYSKGINDSVVSVSAAPATATTTPVMITHTKNKTKNTSLNDSRTDTIETIVNEGAATTKTPDPPVKKANDTKNAEEKRKQSIMNCYYDESDLYKPRPSLRLTSRRYRLGNTENT